MKLSRRDQELYDKVVEWCYERGRKPPAKDDIKGVKNTLKSMKMLGEDV
jgi:hypothetical protein